MEVVFEFLKNNNFTELLLSIFSSGAFGAWLGYKAEKKRAEKELELQKRSYEATINQMEKESELNMRQKQMEWEHEKQLLEASLNRDHIDRVQAAYNEMITAITQYIHLSTPNSKSTALSEIRKFAVVADERLYPLIDSLDDAVSVSDPFEGPDEQFVKSTINQIRAILFK